MSKERSLVFKEGVALQTEPGVARILALNTANEDLDLDDLGLMAEWIATAWENLAGAPYEHEEYDGTLRAVVKAGEYVIPKSAILLLDEAAGRVTRTHDDGNGIERDCE